MEKILNKLLNYSWLSTIIIVAITVVFIMLMKENTKMVLLLAEDTPLSVSFAKQKLTFKVSEAPPGLKGDTVSNTTKDIVLETGAHIQAPLFINKSRDFVVFIYSYRAVSIISYYLRNNCSANSGTT